MLTIYRRHLETCPGRTVGRTFTSCDCPIHCDGIVKGRRFRESMNTVNWARGRRRMAELEEEIMGGRVRKDIEDATALFLADCQVEPSTERKYKRIMRSLVAFADSRGLTTVDRIGLEDLDAYRAGRGLSPLSWSKELQLLRSFFDFAERRKWCEENVGKAMKMPKDPKPGPREPYTEEEVRKIVLACDRIGQSPYERLRARAMILLMRFAGLRISDVATLERSRIGNGEIFLYAAKNGAAVRMPLPPHVVAALAVVPHPEGATADCRYVFWTGLGSKEGHVSTVGRSLQSVFRKSEVAGATAHRFRHTLATEILVNGGTIEDAANVLGDSPAVIRKHYLKWTIAYQSRTTELMRRIHGTPVTRDENKSASGLFSEDWNGGEGGIRNSDKEKPN